MEHGTVLIDILVVLVAAKLAAELAERAGIPAVVGEIGAGVLIGPSVLGVVHADELLTTLGEIGVILLLLEVGMEMDLRELGVVGRASMAAAVVGVVTPMVLGWLVMTAVLGEGGDAALFVGAALTATSVGITARVFGDLRALASREARIVLGAAVADDVIGLLVLTVVVRLVTEGSVSTLSVAGIVVVALGFLLLGGVAGLRVTPPLFSAIERLSRSTGTLVAVALAFTLGFAQLAAEARLAPIIGAFLAGLALARTRQSDRIRRELAPVGHLFIPVFFLQIGIHADLAAFAQTDVLVDAAALLGVAVVGKLLAGVYLPNTPGDRLLVGIGMLPRGEVGLIFAAIGLANGVFGDELYAALLLVVLVTTVMTPPLLRWRHLRLQSSDAAAVPVAEAMPGPGWLRLSAGRVELAAVPPVHEALPVALAAAVAVSKARPSPELLDWLGSVPRDRYRWGSRAADAFLDLLAHGNGRSWRFLDRLGVIERVLPELADALRHRAADPFELDPTLEHRWTTVEALRDLQGERLDEAGDAAEQYRLLRHPEWLHVAALLDEALAGASDRVAVARRVVGRLGLGAAAEQEIATLVGDAALLWSIADHAAGPREETVLQVATHLDKPETARALFLLSLAREPGCDAPARARLTALHDLVQDALAHPELTGLDARNLADRRRAEAIRSAGAEPDVVRRIEEAPRAYVLEHAGGVIAHHAALLEPLPAAGTARVAVRGEEEEAGLYRVDVAALDRPGLLAAVAGALASAGLAVVQATAATWPDGAALESFVLRAGTAPDPAALAARIEEAFAVPLSAPPLPDATVCFAGSISPWHTVVEVTVPDRAGVLHAVATALAAAGADVHSAAVRTNDGAATDRFEVTDRFGAKLGEREQEAISAFVAGGVVTRRDRWPRLWLARRRQPAWAATSAAPAAAPSGSR